MDSFFRTFLWTTSFLREVNFDKACGCEVFFTSPGSPDLAVLVRG